jgi:hypothetical protein
MHRSKLTRFVVVSLALLALMAAVTLGGVWHHHPNSSEANCSICHLNHQPIVQPLSADRVPCFAPIGTKPEPLEPFFAPTPLVRHVPARAPPTA